MSSTGVTIGYGVVVRVGRGPTPTWTTLVGVSDTGFPTFERDEVEVTHHGSPDGTKEYIPGLKDNGEVALTIHWVPGSPTATLLQEIHANAELVQVQWTPPNGGLPEAYVGFLKGLVRTSPLNEAMVYEATFRINGVVEA